VLVVDDDRSVRLTIAAVLAEAGYAVTQCASGSDALARLQRVEFDVILADLRLDDMDGVRVVREGRERWPDTVGLILTGFGSLETAIEALRAGAYDYLCKPCPAEELLATIARAVERRRLSIQVRRQARDIETAIETARELHSALSTRLEGTTALLREREHVLETVCTDLRASLIAIAGLVDILLARMSGAHADAGGEDSPLISASLEQIRREAQGLAQRVTNALNLTRNEDVHVPPQPLAADTLAISFERAFAPPTLPV